MSSPRKRGPIDAAATMMAEFDRAYFVYILASRVNGTLYFGVMNDLCRRVTEHREHVVDGFTKKYRVTCLVWYEVHNDIRIAIQREKQLKKWNRAWKVQLIEQNNQRWDDLFDRLF